MIQKRFKFSDKAAFETANNLLIDAGINTQQYQLYIIGDWSDTVDENGVRLPPFYYLVDALCLKTDLQEWSEYEIRAEGIHTYGGTNQITEEEEIEQL